MRIDTNDPRLIDFALGELDPAEAKQFEAALALPENAEARAEVNALQHLTEKVGEALETHGATLDADQRDAVREAAADSRRGMRVWPFALGLAASLCLGAFGIAGYFRFQNIQKDFEISQLAFEKERIERRLNTLQSSLDAMYLQPSSGTALSPEEKDQLRNEVALLRTELAQSQEELARRSSAASPATAGSQAMDSNLSGNRGGAASAPPAPGAEDAGWSNLPVGSKSNLPMPPAPPAEELPALEQLNASAYIAGGSGAASVPPPPPAPVNRAGETYYVDINGDGVDEQVPFYTRPEEETRFYPRPVTRGTEAYAPIVENPFTLVTQAPLSTFGVDVDTASYTNVRRFLENGQRPPADAVRLEELINYFDYRYAPPQSGSPFAVDVDLAACAWAPQHLLARIALQGQVVSKEERPAVNLVFLLDVSGSMNAPNKLPLVQASMQALLRELDGRDRVGIVTYAGNSQIALTSTSASEPAVIREAIDRLHAGGSTNGAAGIEQAYAMAEQHFIQGAANRVVLATDGDFNVGVTDRGSLLSMIESKREKGVFLTVLGYGMGNIKDATLEQLADKGNGNYAYIDDYRMAQRVLVDQLTGTLVTIAKDVKIQVEFNPANVAAYRLIGYENRALAAEDFNDDRKDAGEIGAGHQVTALYEIVPAGVQVNPQVDDLRYQTPPAPSVEEDRPEPALSDELMTVKLRYKHPDGAKSARIDLPVSKESVTASPDDDFRFASAVAAWGMLLRNSAHKGTATLDLVRELAENAAGSDAERQAFLGLVSMSRSLLH
jgi:secreted protein with Ig-like and vWFA domain